MFVCWQCDSSSGSTSIITLHHLLILQFLGVSVFIDVQFTMKYLCFNSDSLSRH